MTDTARTRFEMGRVVGNTFEVLGSNFGVFILAAAVLAGVPAFVQQLYLGQQVGFDRQGANLIFTVINMFLHVLLQGALVTGAIATLNGAKAKVGDMFARATSAALPLVGLAILQGLGTFLGFLLLIVPGLLLMTIWSVAAPSLVIERIKISEAFGRSRDLTRGRRWAVFGLLVVYMLAVIVLWMIGAILAGMAGGVAGIAGLGGFATALFQGVVAAFGGALSAAGVSALYYELRLTKEGVAPQTVLDTFA